MLLMLLVPKLCLGTPSAKLRFAPSALASESRGETEFRGVGSQTELGNQENRHRIDHVRLILSFSMTAKIFAAQALARSGVSHSLAFTRSTCAPSCNSMVTR